jgi:hypothetical protein
VRALLRHLEYELLNRKKLHGDSGAKIGVLTFIEKSNFEHDAIRFRGRTAPQLGILRAHATPPRAATRQVALVLRENKGHLWFEVLSTAAFAYGVMVKVLSLKS